MKCFKKQAKKHKMTLKEYIMAQFIKLLLAIGLYVLYMPMITKFIEKLIK